MPFRMNYCAGTGSNGEYLTFDSRRWGDGDDLSSDAKSPGRMLFLVFKSFAAHTAKHSLGAILQFG